MWTFSTFCDIFYLGLSPKATNNNYSTYDLTEPVSSKFNSLNETVQAKKGMRAFSYYTLPTVRQDVKLVRNDKNLKQKLLCSNELGFMDRGIKSYLICFTSSVETPCTLLPGLDVFIWGRQL